MKNLSIVILLLVMCSAAQAQNNNFISVFGGITSPSGNWTKTTYNANEVGAWLPTDPDNLASGFAGSGNTFGIEGAYFFSKYFAAGIMVSYSNFYSAGQSALSAGYQQSYDVDSVATTVGAGYTMWTIMPGIYFKYPLSDKFSVTAKVLVGLTSTTTPEIDVHVWDGGLDDGVFTQQKSTASAFGYLAGVGVSYKVLDNIAINLQGNYSSTKPDFTINNTNYNNTAGRRITEYNQPLTAMSFTLGVSYLLTKK
jgi:opacity protein-like surface antigen